MSEAVYKVVSAPAEEPITVAWLKSHANLPTEIDDALLTVYIQAAREMCEQRIGRPIVTQTIARKSDDWPKNDDIELLRAPVQSISSITYLDSAGASQTVSTSVYTLDNADEHGAAWALLQDGQVWPEVGDFGNAVTVTFVAGFGTASAIPAAIKAWIALAATWMTEHKAAAELPEGFGEGLLARYRMWTL